MAAKTRVRSKMQARKIRFKPEEEARIKMKAELYAQGNFSRYIRWAALNCPPKVLTDAD